MFKMLTRTTLVATAFIAFAMSDSILTPASAGGLSLGTSKGIIINNKPGDAAAAKGIIIVDGKKMPFEEAKKKDVDASDAESKGIVIVDGKPMSLSDAAAKGIIIIGSKPGAAAAAKGIIIIEVKPGWRR